jgi:hypothetical protein
MESVVAVPQDDARRRFPSRRRSGRARERITEAAGTSHSRHLQPSDTAGRRSVPGCEPAVAGA